MIDHVALLPVYAAAATALLVLVIDLVVAGRRTPIVGVAVLGTVATGVAAAWVGAGAARGTLCSAGAGCSYVADPISALVGVAFAGLTLAVLGLSAPVLRAEQVPVGEYTFLLACSLTGGVVIGGARDLVSLVVAVETLTLPLYILVGLRRRTSPPPAGAAAAAGAAVTFFVVSVVATTVTLLGAGLLYAATGVLHLRQLVGAVPTDSPLAAVAVTLIVAGLAFKVAAVPFHAWAPATYDGAPLPVAAYLSTASKLGGVVALVYVAVLALPGERTGLVLAVLAVLTMTVGNLVALRQRRMVRLLAWSSVAQAGYILAPLAVVVAAAGRTESAVRLAVGAALAYTVFFVILELTAFAAVVAWRPAAADGGEIADYRGAARRSPWVGAAFVLALAGLAGLPPGLAGLFAKVAVVRALLGGGAGWLALVVALNAVIGLAYYLRVATNVYAPAEVDQTRSRVLWPVTGVLGAAAAAALVVGFAPELVLAAVH